MAPFEAVLLFCLCCVCGKLGFPFGVEILDQFRLSASALVDTFMGSYSEFINICASTRLQFNKLLQVSKALQFTEEVDES